MIASVRKGATKGVTTLEGYGGMYDVLHDAVAPWDRWVSVGNTLREGIGDTRTSAGGQAGAALAIYVGSRI